MNTKNSLFATIIILITLLSAFPASRMYAAEPVPIREIDVDFWLNMNDDRVSVGFCSYAFVARVTANLGLRATAGTETHGPRGPYTSFEVEVFRNIKGDLPETAVVQVMGGYSGGFLHRPRSQNPLEPDAVGLLKVGATYAFQAMGADSKGLFIDPVPNLRTLITENKSLTRGAILELAAPRIAQLLEAYINEVPRPALGFPSDETRRKMSEVEWNRRSKLIHTHNAHHSRYDFQALSVVEQQRLKDELTHLRSTLPSNSVGAPQ